MQAEQQAVSGGHSRACVLLGALGQLYEHSHLLLAEEQLQLRTMDDVCTFLLGRFPGFADAVHRLVLEHNLRGIPALQPVFEHIDATSLAAAGGLSEPEPEPERAAALDASPGSIPEDLTRPPPTAGPPAAGTSCRSLAVAAAPRRPAPAPHKTPGARRLLLRRTPANSSRRKWSTPVLPGTRSTGGRGWRRRACPRTRRRSERGPAPCPPARRLLAGEGERRASLRESRLPPRGKFLKHWVTFGTPATVHF